MRRPPLYRPLRTGSRDLASLESLLYRDDVFALIDSYESTRGGTWSAGACHPLAEALRIVYGGETLGVYDAHGLQHVVTRIDSMLVDADGPQTEAELLDAMVQRERLVDPWIGPLHDTSRVPCPSGLVADLVDLFRKDRTGSIRIAGAKMIDNLVARGYWIEADPFDTARYKVVRFALRQEARGSAGQVEIVLDPLCGFWIVVHARADPGWGPILYDVAMEYATGQGSGLASDRSSVSAEAYRVWDYYYRNRPDVDHVPIDPDQAHDECVLPPFEDELVLNHVFSKSPDLLPRLEAEGLLRWV